MGFIKVIPQAGLTSAEHAEQISRELFRIQRPTNQQGDATQYLFGWVKHPTQDPNYTDVVDTALVVDPAQVIYVHPDNDLTNLIALFERLTEQEWQMLAGFIQSQQSFVFQYIVPSDTKIFTHEEMDAAGWFPAADIV